MKKTIRFVAFLLTLTLLFSCFGITNARDSDPKFSDYINMDEKGEQNGFVIPNLFRQDAVYSNYDRFPLVVSGGVEYVPISMFILYSYVDVTYSRYSDDFFILNSKNHHYITFNVEENVAAGDDGTLFQVSPKVFNKTRYIPARAVAEVLGFTCESYDDPENGIYAFRISDGKSKYTLPELIKPYVDKYLPGLQNDPIQQLASRVVCLCFDGLENENTKSLLNTMTRNSAYASFALSKDEIEKNISLVREIYTRGHDFVLKASAEGQTPREYGESFVENLNLANDALEFVIKKKTRVCILPENISPEIKENAEFLSVVENAGYVVWRANTQSGDSDDYQGSAYTVSGNIKNQITTGFDENMDAVVTANLYISNKSAYYVADIAVLVNKYDQFSFKPADEVYLTRE